MEVTRGDIVIVAAKGAYTGKPRPALVVQADAYNPTHASVTICPITTDIADAPLFRVTLPGGLQSGLATVSQVMVDKIVSVPRKSVTRQIGRCDATLMASVETALRGWLALD